METIINKHFTEWVNKKYNTKFKNMKEVREKFGMKKALKIWEKYWRENGYDALIM